MMSSICGLKLIFIAIFIIIVSGYAKDISGVKNGHNRLNEYISHYETLNYDHEDIRASHNRAKRSVTKDHHVNLKFSAHGRHFHLRLKRDLNTFSDNLEFYDSNGPIDVATDHIYEGVVIGDRNSYVFGSILDGVFEGKIITERDAYYVEHAKRYFPINNSTTTAATTTKATINTINTNNYQIADAQYLALQSTANENNFTKTTIQTKKRTATTTNATLHLNTTSNESLLSDSTTMPNFDEDNQDKATIDNGYHSIIYKESHVDDPYQNMREGHVGGCGITEEVSQWMENIQNSAVEELPEPMSKDDKQNAKTHNIRKKENGAASVTENFDSMSNGRDHSNSNNNYNNHNNTNSGSGSNGRMDDNDNDDEDSVYYNYAHQKYSKEANNMKYYRSSLPAFNGEFYDPETGSKLKPGDADWDDHMRKRVRRAAAAALNGGSSSTPTNRREDNKNTCSLYIQTDPLIWRHIREGIVDHDRGRKNEVDLKTREEITSLIAHHVTAVNYIYRNTKFDGRTEHRNIRFEVQRIKIDDDSACRTSYNGPHNAFCNEHMDVSNFLNLHSLEDHSDFCLAYVFTYRDFTGGTLGLAWVASASGASGGICEKFKTYTETVGGQYQSTKRSLNTGIITFVNYNSRVPPKVSQLTLAHEIGHNFGSPHDYPQECRPGGLNGNYIMFASATSGDRPNNSKFSPCSIRNISNVLDVLVGNTKRDCFKIYEGAFCGNKIVESGEECDCGFNEEECKDKCCYPRLISEYEQSLNSSAQGCRRRNKTQCSPSQGPCCLSSSCTFVPAMSRVKCKEETECSWSSNCNGSTAECPEPKPRDDKTKCNNGTALCIGGECSGSICLLWNMSECFLTSQVVPHVDKRKLCELACQNGNDSSTCRSTSEFAHLFGLPEGGINLQPGSPCDNFQGYCDVLRKCRAVDADGPLLRLKNLLLNREVLQTVAQWITENWYIVVLMGIGFIIVMGIFIKCCAVHTPSSNPKKRRARRFSETLRAPMNTLRRMRHPHARGGAEPRSIPPPVHEQHSRHRNHPPEWDHRRDGPPHRSGGGGGGAGGSHHHHHHHGTGGHSIVPLPVGGSHASRGRPPSSGNGGGGRSSRSNAVASSSSRQPSNSRSAHGYGDSHHLSAGLVMGGGGGGGVSSAGVGGGSGAISRQQMPLPSLPPNAIQEQHHQQQQQQQLPHHAYAYGPKVAVPPPVSCNSRPASLHNPDLYADAYAAMGRGTYEVTTRMPQSNKL